MTNQRVFRSVFLCFVLLCGTLLSAQGREYIQTHYTKHEYYVPMRDGVKLFSAVYTPKDATRKYPIMFERTPYTIAPYGVDHYPQRLGPSELFAKEGFIFAYQDVRGRYMSEGVFEALRPHKPEKRATDTDESTDTWDTIDWLVKNIPNNNGRVGMSGISYNGFFVAAGMIDAHPALKAASPQAPVGDCYMGDDCYHNGALWLPHNFSFYTFFEPRRGGPERPGEFHPSFDYGTPDGYDFYLRMGPVANSKKLLNPANVYWNQTIDHPTYDEFWQSRAITRFFRNLPPAVLTVGGWFDAEDLSGTLRVFRAADKANAAGSHLVMGPWQHGGWARGDGDRLGNLYFASKTAAFYRDHIEFPFFMQQLKDAKDAKEKPFPKAWVFETGSNEWRTYDSWPPKNASATTFYLAAAGRLLQGPPPAGAAFDEYLSDPNRPVPLLGHIAPGMTADYMTEDQRFASERPDVLVYETEPLAHDVTVAGPVSVRLFVSTSGTDSDFDVKLIDVYPGDFPNPPDANTGEPGAGQRRAPRHAVKMGGYQQLVRGEPFRGRYRNSFQKPEPFAPGSVAKIEYAMPDICHTFRKGHRIMVQVQSSWFPLSDRNPQTFVPDIANASPADFQKATERVYHTPDAPSGITLLVEK